MTRFAPATLHVLVLALALSIGLLTGAPALALTAAEILDDPNALLLEAELIELTEGDVPAALERYRQILGRDDLGTDVRARTLFALARAHRKLGELGAAKERYEELVRDHADQAALVKAAHRYLAEIEEGAEDLPTFDWVKEVEQSPAIRAQIFDWGMSLIGTDEESRTAKAKLMALGRTVTPILLPMYQNSSNEVHREALASILVPLGRFELAVELIQLKRFSTEAAETVGHGLREADDAVRESVVAELASNIDPDDFWQRKSLALVRVTMGETAALEDDLAYLRNEEWRFVDGLWDDPEMASRLHAILREYGRRGVPAYTGWLAHLLRGDPEVLVAEDFAPFLEREPDEDQNVPSMVMRAMVARGYQDTVLRLLTGPNPGRFTYRAENDRTMQRAARSRARNNSYDPADRPSCFVFSAYPRPVPPRLQAEVCAANDEGVLITLLALKHDDAIEPFVDWLRTSTSAFHTADPSLRWHPFGRAIHAFDRRNRDDELERLGFPEDTPLREDPRFSPAFVDAMWELARAPGPPITRSIALDLLLRSEETAGTTSGTRWIEELRRNRVTEGDDVLAMQLVAGAILALDREHAEDHAADLNSVLAGFAEGGPLGSPLLILPEGEEIGPNGQLPYRSRIIVGWSEEGARTSAWEAFAWQILTSRLAAEHVTDVLRTLLGSDPIGPETARLFIRLYGLPRRSDGDFSLDEVSEALGRFSSIEQVAEFYTWQLNHVSRVVAPKEVCRQLILDPSLDLAVRQQAVLDLGREEFLDPAPWIPLLLGDDPISARILSSGVDLLYRVGEWTPEQMIALFGARSPDVRAAGVLRLPAERFTVEHFATLIRDESPKVQQKTWDRLREIEHARVLPVLHDLVRGAVPPFQALAITRVAEFADPSSIPILTSLLDDPVLSVRRQALDALKRIDEIHAERRKWTTGGPPSAEKED